MGARKYELDFGFDEDVDPTLENCFHDQQRTSRTSSTRLAAVERSSSPDLLALERGSATRSGVVPINRTSAPSPPAIPRAGTVPEFVVGERTSAFELHEPPRSLPVTQLVLATSMFLAMTVLGAIAYYH